MSYAIQTTPGVFVDHEALASLSAHIEPEGTKAVLVGWGEYAKHLINLHSDKIFAVYDPDPLFEGITFRNVPVVSLETTNFDPTIILCCEYKHAYEFLGRVVRRYNWLRWYFPPRLHYKNTEQVAPFDQELIYHDILSREADAPISMMAPDKIRFLMELLRYGLSRSATANVVEMGSWQGGSSWYIAQILRHLGGRRIFYMMDLFELHQMDPTATMCTDEVRARMNAAYDRVELVVGLVDDPACVAMTKPPFCFAHVDLGFLDDGLRFVWDNLVPGAPLLLDNYGHLAAPTWKFDDFFQARGTRVIRLPWSEQGLVFKT